MSHDIRRYLNIVESKFTRVDEMIVYRDRFRKEGDERATVIAINPTRAEWNSSFPNGAAGVLCKDGRIVIGEGSMLAHDVIMNYAKIPESLEKYPVL